MDIESFGIDRKLISANIWQYDKADPFLSLLRQKDDWYDQNFESFWGMWYNQIFRLEIDYTESNNLHTYTNLFGCVVWAIILDFPLEPILVPREGMKQPWAFENIDAPYVQGVSRENFGVAEGATAEPHQGGNFTPASNVAALTLLEKVQLLKLAYYRNIGNCSVPFLNRMLKDVFTITGKLQPTPITQTPYVIDGQDMTMTYVFPYKLSVPLTNAIGEYDVLPKPTGVELLYQWPV